MVVGRLYRDPLPAKMARISAMSAAGSASERFLLVFVAMFFT
jgi:hypothetical protein